MTEHAVIDSDKVHIKFCDVEFEGYVEATFPDVEPDVLAVTDPNITRASGSGTINMTLLAEGDGNDVLGELAREHQEHVLDEIAEMVGDGRAYIKKILTGPPPPGVTEKTWVFCTNDFNGQEMRIHEQYVSIDWAETFQIGKRLDRKARRRARMKLWKKRGRR